MRTLLIVVILFIARMVMAETRKEAAMKRFSPIKLQAVVSSNHIAHSSKAIERTIYLVNKSRSSVLVLGKMLEEAVVGGGLESWRLNLPKIGQAVAFTGLLVQVESVTFQGENFSNCLALVVPASEFGYRFTVVVSSFGEINYKLGELVDILGRVIGDVEYIDSIGVKRTAVLISVPAILKAGELGRIFQSP